MNKLLQVWASRPEDRRGTASTVHTYTIVKGSAASMARQVDAGGDIAIGKLVEQGCLVSSPTNAGSVAQPGYGVQVQYPSGKVCVFHYR